MKKTFLGLITASILFLACGGSSEPLVKSDSGNSSFPGWYSSFGFTSDSTHFYGYGTAVSSDQQTAVSRAEREARAVLESYIAKELEDIRSDLERDGNKEVTEKSFILKLRNAHYQVEESAELVESSSTQKEDVFRGFASVQISKEEVKTLVENGLVNSVFTNTVGFKEFIDQ